jgi:DNA polymerase-3 subunit epsilon
MSWSDGRLMAFDTETTGVDPETARIVSAACLWRGGDSEAVDEEWLINPGVPIPPEATAIHGITDEMAEAGHDPADALDELAQCFLTAAFDAIPVIVYNAPYDLTVLDREALRYRVEMPHISRLLVIDPLVIDKAIDPYRKGSRKLVDVAACYHVPEEGKAHGAVADALMAARLAVRFSRLPEIAEMTLQQLHDAQIGWRFTQAASFEAYLERKGTPEKIARDWPVLPRG